MSKRRRRTAAADDATTLSVGNAQTSTHLQFAAPECLEHVQFDYQAPRLLHKRARILQNRWSLINYCVAHVTIKLWTYAVKSWEKQTGFSDEVHETQAGGRIYREKRTHHMTKHSHSQHPRLVRCLHPRNLLCKYAQEFTLLHVARKSNEKQESELGT